jgi:hypothetical protein
MGRSQARSKKNETLGGEIGDLAFVYERENRSMTVVVLE